MTYRGKMTNGTIVFEGSERPPEGAVVTVQFSDDPLSDEEQLTLAKQRDAIQRLVELGKKVGQLLPTDASRNVDHYLYGAPKR